MKRNFYHGPGFNYTDWALFKDFPIGNADSPRYVEVRMEAFNVFNHPNFSNPDGSVYDQGSTFGDISGLHSAVNGDPSPGRDVQLAAKIYF